MWPIAKAIVKTVKPKAKAMPSIPIPICGKLEERTTLPHPPNTSQKVPINSAIARFERGIRSLLSLKIVELIDAKGELFATQRLRLTSSTHQQNPCSSNDQENA